MPTSLVDQIFTNDGWTIPKGGYYDNKPLKQDGTGFAATIYNNGKSDEVVLAIRGTEPKEQGGHDLWETDIKKIGADGFASDQTIEMINFIEKIKASKEINSGKYKHYSMKKLTMFEEEYEL